MVRFVFSSCILLALIGILAQAQSLGNAGTIEISVLDPTGAVVPNAKATLSNPITGYSRSAQAGSDQKIRFINVPPNQYHLSVTSAGFSAFTQDVAVRTSVPIKVQASLALASEATTVEVEATGADLVENDPNSHVDVDRNTFSKLPVFDPGAGLSQAITLSTGGVASDSNGSFHPLGDHAQVSFVIDGQPISDQQSKVFSTQLPTSAIQSMSLNTGAPNAEFGDKSSLVDQPVSSSAALKRTMEASAPLAARSVTVSEMKKSATSLRWTARVAGVFWIVLNLLRFMIRAIMKPFLTGSIISRPPLMYFT